ncbi:hypothetical protein TNCV_1757061 [Trichonephila clavipes]|nr:hypothetical protein TNCV_1757061 [Trichonephila clavipes]
MIAKEKCYCRDQCEKLEYLCNENEILEKAYVILGQIHHAIKAIKDKYKHKPLINPSELDRLEVLNGLDEALDVSMENMCSYFDEMEDKMEKLQSFLFKGATNSQEKLDKTSDLYDDIEDIQMLLDDLIIESEDKIYAFLHSIQKGGKNRKNKDKELESVFVEPLELESVFVEPLELESVFVEPLELESVFVEPLELESVFFVEPLELESVFVEPLELESVFVEPLELESVFVEPLELESVFVETVEPLELESVFTEPLELESVFVEPLELESVFSRKVFWNH